MPEISKPSIQSLLIEMRFGEQKLANGTGFTVETHAGKFLITNRHNVTGRNQDTGKPLSKSGGVPDNIRILHNSAEGIGSWVWKKEDLYLGEEPLWFEHPVLGAKADFVALRLTNLSQVQLYPFNPENPGPNLSVTPSVPVSVVGFPFGISAGGSFGVWATGFLASEPAINFDNLPKMLIDCRTRQGQSGSPVIVFQRAGAVKMADGSTAITNGDMTLFLGIYSGRINAESDIGVVWKAEAIAELMASITPYKALTF